VADTSIVATGDPLIQGGATECVACRPCPTLPSSETAYRVVIGDPGAVPYLARDLVLRGALCAVGIYAFGSRAHLMRNALSCAAGIECFVLAWVWFNAWNRGEFAPPPPAPVLAPGLPAGLVYPEGPAIR